jgi:uncharacterized protein
MPELATLASAFLLGLMGSTHCLGMCGGISAALGMAGRRRVLFALSYNLGRIACYAALGALAGGAIALLGAGVREWLPAIGLVLRTAAGLLVIAMGLYVAGWWLGLTRLEALGSRLWRRVQPLTRTLLPPRHAGAALALGALWGLLPCGLVYSSLSYAAVSGDSAHGAALMAAFGLGTGPAMLLTALGAQQLQRRLQQPLVRRCAGAVLIVFGTASAILPWLHSGADHGAAHQHAHH